MIHGNWSPVDCRAQNHLQTKHAKVEIQLYYICTYKIQTTPYGQPLHACIRDPDTDPCMRPCMNLIQSDLLTETAEFSHCMHAACSRVSESAKQPPAGTHSCVLTTILLYWRRTIYSCYPTGTHIKMRLLDMKTIF